MKICLDNVRAARERERKGEDNLFKSGRKKSVRHKWPSSGVQPLISNERSPADDGMGKTML